MKFNVLSTRLYFENYFAGDLTRSYLRKELVMRILMDSAEMKIRIQVGQSSIYFEKNKCIFGIYFFFSLLNGVE